MPDDRVTFCRICEAHCGLVATVEDGRVTQLRPDREHPLSRGYACPKGIAMTEVQNDPDRVVHPLRRRAGGGGFERVSWEEALDDIGRRLRAVLERHGPASVGWYMGNPGAFSYAHTLWVKGFLDALGSPHYYSAGSQDVNNRFAASALLYGTPLLVPIPDLARTAFLLILGANPLVSHGSVLTAPRVARPAARRRAPRRARRRRRPAPHGDRPPVRARGRAPRRRRLAAAVAAARALRGGPGRRARARRPDRRGAGAARGRRPAPAPRTTARRTGVEEAALRALARDLAAAPSAAVYGRTGSCLGRFGTLTAFLIDAVNVVTGNLDVPGGAVFGRPAIALDEVGERTGLATYGRTRSRVGDFPDVIGNLPASLLPREITTPGERQIRALFVSAGNPVLSVPDGDALEAALGELDLCVSLDLYVNETNRHADYVLPAATWLERDDLPIAFLGFYTTPFVQWTDAVVPPRGEAREEWEIVRDLAHAAGVEPYSVPALRRLARLGLALTPRRLAVAAAAHRPCRRSPRPAAAGAEPVLAAPPSPRRRHRPAPGHRRAAAPHSPPRLAGAPPRPRDRGRAAAAGRTRTGTTPRSRCA